VVVEEELAATDITTPMEGTMLLLHCCKVVGLEEEEEAKAEVEAVERVLLWSS
jgi:hypothetical protein